MKKTVILLLAFMAIWVLQVNGQLSVSIIDTDYHFDFDNTVAGVNNGSFAGTGFATVPTAGQLDAGAWAISGMSDLAGLKDFGVEATTGDYARGVSTGVVTTGGLYAFEVETGNIALGVQPSGADFTPGWIGFKLQNNTGENVNFVQLSYDIWVLNDGAWSSSFNGEFSPDGTTWFPIPEALFSTPEVADATPTWVKSTITIGGFIGAIIPNNSYIYFRWNSNDVAGASARDEIALDNFTISLSNKILVSSFPFIETFEDDSPTRDSWEQIYEDQTNDWTFEQGNVYGAMTTAYEGILNAYFDCPNYSTTKLITPYLHLSLLNNPQLVFWYAQEDNWGDQNELKLYYRENNLEPWVELAYYTENVDVWTKEIINLPNKSNSYQIAFEGMSDYGYANVIDYVTVRETPTDLVDWCNLQWPDVGSVNTYINYDVYAQVYESGVTDAPGQGAGVECWIGYSDVNSDPSTWTNWFPASYNIDAANNDEYMASLSFPNTGTYYYASRFRLNEGNYSYGGYDDLGGNFWNGSTYVSGVVNVTAIPGTECAEAIAYANINDAEYTTTIDAVTRELWFTVVLNQDYANVEFSTCSAYDTYLYIYDECGGTELDSNDDAGSGPCEFTNQSLVDFPILTAGTYYVKITPYADWVDISNPTTKLLVTGFNCMVPNSIAETNLTQTTTDITWLPSALGETDWIIKVSTTPLMNPSTETGDILNNQAVSTNPVQPLSGLTSETDYYVYIQSACGSEWAEYLFTTPAACPIPTGLSATVLSSSTATLNWNSLGTTDWLLKVSTTYLTDPSTESGDFLDNEPIIGAIAQYGLTGLNAKTTYYWYVMSDCGSDWSIEGEFTTPCDAFTTLPFHETFDLESTSIDCWTIQDENEDYWVWYIDPYALEASFYSDGNNGNNNDYLISPGITLTGNEILTYQYRVNSWDEPNDFEVLLSTTGTSSSDFTTVLLPNAAYNNQEYEMQTIDLSAYTGTVYIAWHIINGGLDGWVLYINDVWVRAQSTENDILSFSFVQQTSEANIDVTNHTVDIGVAMGTDPNGIVPTFTISNFATVDIASDIARDFSTPVTYNITSELGATQPWVINTTVATTQSSENDIITFFLTEQTGPATIDPINHTVDIEVTWITDITLLTPEITISFLATIDPESGLLMDFSAPFTYTVTAEDGTIQNWIVTVTKTPAPLGANCSNPIIITQSALPYIEIGGSNCGMGNIYQSTCLGSYDAGEDIIYRLDIIGSSEVNITMTTASTWTGIAILDACPDTGNCLDNSTLSGSGTQILNAVLTSGSYYIIIDTWPSPNCIPAYDLYIEIVPKSINIIDLYSVVEDIEVCAGTNFSTAIGELAQQIVITDTEDNEFSVNLVWDIASYDANTPGIYNATGTFTLPYGVEQTSTPTPLEVTAIITVNALPVVTCPADFEVTTTDVVTLTGGSPAAGVYSGTGVTSGDFDPSTLANGPYTITYTYNDGVCDNFCDFVITVNIPNPQIAAIDINSDVQDIEVCLGTDEATTIADLATEITITDTDATEHIVSLTWTVAAYDAMIATDYTATGTFTLPTGVDQTSTPTPLEVTATVTVNALPVVTCPENFTVNEEGVVALTGGLPEGGTYSGTGVTANNFDPSSLIDADYTITYEYTDGTSDCSKTCDFVITVDLVNSINANQTAEITIYPNPNNGLFNLSFGNVNGKVNYQIYDTKGSIIVNENIQTNGNTIKEVSLNLVPGVYYVRIITETQTLVEKLVIE